MDDTQEGTYAERARANRIKLDAQAWNLRQQGLSLIAIGKEMGVSAERARQRLRRHERYSKCLMEREARQNEHADR